MIRHRMTVLLPIVLIALVPAEVGAQGNPPSGAGNVTALIADLQAQIDALKEAINQVDQQATQRINIVQEGLNDLSAVVDLVPGRFSAYTNRAAFAAAAGATTDIDFSALPAGPDSFHTELTLGGVTFKNVYARNQAPFAPFVYRAHVTHNPIVVAVPPGTRAVGADIASFRADPGLYTITLSTGQESTTTSGSGFIGVVSDKPLEWISIRFYSACSPSAIYGVATCPGFPSGYLEEVLVMTALSLGPGS